MGVVRRLQDARKPRVDHRKHASTPTPLAAAQRVALPARGRGMAGVGGRHSIRELLNLHSNDEEQILRHAQTQQVMQVDDAARAV